MPNHYFIISEVQFFNDKEDKKTWKFVSGTGINLNLPYISRMPTLIEIKKELVDLGNPISNLKELHFSNFLKRIAIYQY
jgi:hypothetical protein